MHRQLVVFANGYFVTCVYFQTRRLHYPLVVCRIVIVIDSISFLLFKSLLLQYINIIMFLLKLFNPCAFVLFLYATYIWSFLDKPEFQHCYLNIYNRIGLWL